MHWSSQLEQDCARLASEMETEGDKLLASLASISRICLQVTEVNRHLSDNSGTYTALHIAPLIASLNQVRGTLSDEQTHHSKTVSSYPRIPYSQ